MILKSNVFFLLIIFSHGDPLNNDPYFVYEYDENVKRIDKFGDIYGVFLQTKIVLQKIQEIDNVLKVEDVGTIKIVESGSKLVDYKLIKNNTAIYCTDVACVLCSELSIPTSYCTVIGVHKTPFYWFAIATYQNQLYLAQTVVNFATHISVYEMSDDIHTYKLIQQIEEPYPQFGRKLIGAFTRKGFVYIVGDYVKQYGEKYNYRHSHNILPKLTRICVDDSTENLSSRVDLVLYCKSNGTVDINYIFPPTSFTYDDEGDKLYVALAEYFTQDILKETTICEFDFASLDENFNKTWTLYQEMDLEATAECDSLGNTNIMPDECFIESADDSCKDINGTLSKLNSTFYDSFCDNYNEKVPSKCGNLVNYKAVMGKQVFVSKNPVNFKSLKKTATSNIVLSTTSDDMLDRIIIGDNYGFASTPVSSVFSYYDPVLSKTKVFRVPRSSQNVLKFISMTCTDLYKETTCNQVLFSDPLKCEFCARQDGSGFAVESDKCKSPFVFKSSCPPVLKTVDKTSDRFIVKGLHLDRILTEKQLFICGQRCFFATFNSESIQCRIINLLGVDCRNDRTVVFSGKLNFNENAVNFTILLDASDAVPVNPFLTPVFTSTSSYINGLFVVPIIAVIVICSKLPQRILKIHQLWKLRIQYKNSSYPYKNMSIPLSDMSKSSYGSIDITQLRVLEDEKPIGKGHFAVVKLARYYVDIENDETMYQQVAVKVMDFKDEDVMREIDILRSCRHKNIVSFIGDLAEDNRVLIVMEYMDGGSLVTYLQNKLNKPTMGTCFDYMMQVLSGMVYLSENNIIHRDLAARNCVLNATYDVLKICDFGLSRKTVDDVYVSFRNQFLPLPWLPMENLKDNRLFHMKTDIWMFGILVWELFTRASKPYENLGVDTVDSLYNYLSQGNRLAKPPHCPTKLYDIMLRCWKADKDERPTFVELDVEIADLLKRLQNSPEKKLDHVYSNVDLNHVENNQMSM